MMLTTATEYLSLKISLPYGESESNNVRDVHF